MLSVFFLLTDVAEFPRLGGAFCRLFGAERTQPVADDSAGVVPGGAQGVTEVTEDNEKTSTTVAERRRQTTDQLGVSTAQRQTVTASHEEHCRQVTVHPTCSLTVICDSNNRQTNSSDSHL